MNLLVWWNYHDIKFSFHLIARAVKDCQKVREVLCVNNT
nr:MAG TPA: hypothetical protein [Caudoviricetes sp.]DAH49526.1 MAG TPA: hypothetical protein [Caudoviricetes sp.]